MATTLTYGTASTCQLDSIEATLLRPQQMESIPVEQIAARVRKQLAEPIHFPPLAQSTIPGDCVTVAVGPGIPQQLAVIDGALQALRDAGAEEGMITLLMACSSQSVETLQSDLVTLGHDQCRVKVHDPDHVSDQEKENAFLGVTQAGQALRLNRALCEADFVLPLTVTNCERLTNELPSSFAGLFPDFSDRETLARFSSANAEKYPTPCSENFSDVEQCGRQLGVGIMVQLVPGPGGQVATVLAGDPTVVAQQAQAKYHQIWCAETEVRGNLVIATLTGDAEQQTWQNVSRAIEAAESVLEPGGSIVICSELAEPPGGALSRLAGDDDYLVVEREILQNPSTDSSIAMQLCRALHRGPVYLRSQLRSSLGEGLGFTPIESDSELDRLSQAHRPCLILEEAQRLLPTVNEIVNETENETENESKA